MCIPQQHVLQCFIHSLYSYTHTSVPYSYVHTSQDVDAADLAALNKQVCKALQENKALRFVPSTKMIANITTAAKQQGMLWMCVCVLVCVYLCVYVPVCVCICECVWKCVVHGMHPCHTPPSHTHHPHTHTPSSHAHTHTPPSHRPWWCDNAVSTPYSDLLYTICASCAHLEQHTCSTPLTTVCVCVCCCFYYCCCMSIGIQLYRCRLYIAGKPPTHPPTNPAHTPTAWLPQPVTHKHPHTPTHPTPTPHPMAFLHMLLVWPPPPTPHPPHCPSQTPMQQSKMRTPWCMKT